MDDPTVLCLFILRFGAGGDARRLGYGLRGYLHRTLGEVLADHRRPLLEADPPLAAKLRGVRFELDRGSPLPEAVASPFGGTTRVLLVDDDEWAEAFPEPFACWRAETAEAVDEALRLGGADLVLLDLHIGCGAGEDDRTRGLSLLRRIRTRFPDVPVYLFSEAPEARGLSAELLERVRLEGGARGILAKRFFGVGGDAALERTDFFRQLRVVDAAQRRQRLVEHYGRRAKVLDFEVVPRLDRAGPDGFLPLELTRVREITAVSALDRAGRGWVDLPRERLGDLAGAEQAKLRLGEVVRWLTDPGPLRELGLQVPRGILLTGPPGTGKTTLARAVAGEAEVPFFAISASEVQSKWLGESEANVRELFACARRYAPSVVFIDEIDSIGRRRSGDASAGGQWQTSLLNELLAQMDGFRQSDRPVFVLAATNRADILDPALLRPGRFDLQVEVPNPSAPARAAIFRLHLKGKPLAGDVDPEALSLRTAGLSGAEIKQVCQEAGLLALRKGARHIAQAHLQEAVTTVRMGTPSEHFALDEEARWTTAVHEAGHALAQHLLFPDELATQVTILPRGRALGFAESASTREYVDPTAERLRLRVRVFLAGRAAEELLLGADGVTTGCANDLERASALALRVVANWGLDPALGPVSLEGLRRALSDGGPPVGRLALEDEAVERSRTWLAEQQDAVRSLIEQHKPALEALAKALLERETLYQEDLAALLGTRPVPG